MKTKLILLATLSFISVKQIAAQSADEEAIKQTAKMETEAAMKGDSAAWPGPVHLRRRGPAQRRRTAEAHGPADSRTAHDHPGSAALSQAAHPRSEGRKEDVG